MIKYVLVQVAQEELEHGSQQISTSRISVITGVHRKDVSRITSSQGEYQRPGNLIAKVMTQWQCDKRFTSSSGKPRVLGCEGKDSEFAELVAAVNGKDVSSYSVLFEMERSGIVEHRGKKVKLLGRDFVQSKNVEEGLALLAADSEDLISSVEQNIFFSPDTPNLHLRTEFDRIPVSELPGIKKWLLREGSLFQQKVRRYISQYDLDTSGREDEGLAVGRVALGTFSVTDQ